MNSYSLSPSDGSGTLVQRLLARATEIDSRLGPIPGAVADRLVCELREAAEALSAVGDPSHASEQRTVA
jgi:hypothetical protein